MTSRDDLLAALLAERYDQTWWPTPIREVGSVAALRDESPSPDDNDLEIARRRREMADDFEAHDRPERKAT